MSLNSGIYLIINIINNNVYVGSSSRLKRRLDAHKQLLISDKHHSVHLQNAWNKYGGDNFIFRIIEFVENVDLLVVREQYYIDYYVKSIGRYNLYNTRLIADSNRGIERSKEFKEKVSKANKDKVVSDKTREKLSKANLGKKQSPEILEKLSAIRKGKKHSEATKEKMRIAQQKRRLKQQNSGGVSEETRQKLSDRFKGKRLHPNVYEALSKARTGKPLPDKTKIKQSETLKKTWANKKVEFESMTPEQQLIIKQKRSDAAKRAYQTKIAKQNQASNN